MLGRAQLRWRLEEYGKSLEELVQQSIERETAGIDGTAITRQERRDPRFSKVVPDAPGGQCQILMTIGDAGTRAIDESREPAVIRDQVRKAGIAMGHHEILVMWPVFLEFLEQSDRTAAEAFIVEIVLVDETGTHARMRQRDVETRPDRAPGSRSTAANRARLPAFPRAPRDMRCRSPTAIAAAPLRRATRHAGRRVPSWRKAPGARAPTAGRRPPSSSRSSDLSSDTRPTSIPRRGAFQCWFLSSCPTISGCWSELEDRDQMVLSTSHLQACSSRSSFRHQNPCAPHKRSLEFRAFQPWGHSSAGRAPAWHAGGRRFDPAWLHQVPVVRPGRNLLQVSQRPHRLEA